MIKYQIKLDAARIPREGMVLSSCKCSMCGKVVHDSIDMYSITTLDPGNLRIHGQVNYACSKECADMFILSVC